MSEIEDFTESELWIMRTTPEERYVEPIEPALAEGDLRLNPFGTELNLCSTAHRKHEGCHIYYDQDRLTALSLPVLLPCPLNVRHRRQ